MRRPVVALHQYQGTVANLPHICWLPPRAAGTLPKPHLAMLPVVPRMLPPARFAPLHPRLPGLSGCLQEMLKNVKRGKGQPVEETPTEEITPQPGWVLHHGRAVGWVDARARVHVHVCAQACTHVCV
jgi:hypothetical protein